MHARQALLSGLPAVASSRPHMWYCSRRRAAALHSGREIRKGKFCHADTLGGINCRMRWRAGPLEKG
eukprot:12522108-Alexandrium_andersonii.AAC.1